MKIWLSGVCAGAAVCFAGLSAWWECLSLVLFSAAFFSWARE